MDVCRGEGDGGGDSVWSDQWGIPLWSVCPSVRPWCYEVTSGWKSWIRDVHTARTGVPRVKPSVPGVCSFSVGSFGTQSYDKIASNLLTGVLSVIPVKTKRRPLYLKTQSVPRCKNSFCKLNHVWTTSKIPFSERLLKYVNIVWFSLKKTIYMTT